MPLPPGEFWLDESALPDRIWARLFSGLDGWFVQDCDGKLALFETRDAAIAWLREDEYESLAALVERGDVAADLTPPESLFGARRGV